MAPLTARLKWGVRRIGAMAPGEILARIQRSAVHAADDFAWRRARAVWRRRWYPADLDSSGGGPLGLLTAERARGLDDACPGERQRVIDRADRFLRGEIQFFGYPPLELPLPIDYRVDAHTGFTWPSLHGKRLDYRHVAGGDPKWIWELNRLQELPSLIQAWLLTGDASYATAATDEVLRWAEQNPPGCGVAWVNGYEAGVRAISLALVFAGLRASDAPLDDEERRAFVRLLWQHGRWIRRDPSTHSSANNHRLGELVGLVVLSALTPELPQAGEWLHDALEGVAREAERQVLPDGIGAEQAFAYHVYVVDLLLVAVAAVEATGRPAPDAVMRAVRRSGDSLWAQIASDEEPLTYGDSDDAVAVRLGSSELRDARSVAATIAARLDHPKARAVAAGYDGTAWWMFGPEGRTRFDSTPEAAAPRSDYLPAGGLVVLRRGETRVTMDVGPLGYLSIAAHGHADALALTVSAGGQTLVVDPGVGSYWRSSEVRDAFRGTPFHATLDVDDTDQSEPGGPFLWIEHAKVDHVQVDLERGFVEGEHDGYLRLSDPVRHRRAIALLREDALVVIDQIEARGRHTLRQNWPLAPTLTVETQDDAVAASAGGHPVLRISTVGTTAGTLHVAEGCDEPFLGWWSRRLESWDPAPHVSWSFDTSGSQTIASLLTCGRRPPEGQLRLDAAAAHPAVEVELEGERFVVPVDAR
jgi:hypothetical protein